MTPARLVLLFGFFLICRGLAIAGDVEKHRSAGIWQIENLLGDPSASGNPLEGKEIRDIPDCPRIDRVIHALVPKPPYDVRKKLEEFGISLEPDEAALYSTETGLLFYLGREEYIAALNIVFSSMYTPPSPNVEITLRAFRRSAEGAGKEVLNRILASRRGAKATFERRNGTELQESFEIVADVHDSEKVWLNLAHEVKLEGRAA